MAVADHAYRTFPDESEGWLSRARAAVVRTTALAEMAIELGLGDVVRLGKGEDASGGREKPSILADTLEAVIGAVYLDGGWEPARALVLRLLAGRMAALASGDGDQDDKGRLQELLARRGDPLPRYELVGEGPEHDKVFRAVVRVAGAVAGEGTGRSKKQAEQMAARVARTRLISAPSEAEPAASEAPGSIASPVSSGSAVADGETRHEEHAGHDGRASKTNGTRGENHG